MGWNFEALELVGGRGGLVGGPSEAFRVEMVPGEEQKVLSTYRKILKEIWHTGVLLVIWLERWREVPDRLGPDFKNFLMVVVAEDEGCVLQIKSPYITGEANKTPIPCFNIIPCLKLPHRTL